MQRAMATLGLYTVIVFIVALALGSVIHYSAAHFSDNIRKLIIILSFFIILGISTYAGDST